MTASPLITAGRCATLIQSPPGEKRWGFYQFPDMWRAAGGEIYCAVNVGHDSLMGQHEPSQFFVSRDQGTSWQRVAYDKVDRSPEIFTFSDGAQVSFGRSRFIYHVQACGPLQDPWQVWNFAELGMKPISGYLRDGYDNTDWQLFSLDDLPRSHRRFDRAYRASPSAQWQRDESDVDLSNLFYLASTRNMWWDESGKPVAEEIPPRAMRIWPHWGSFDVQVLPDDTLLWAQLVGHPDSSKLHKPIWSVALFASTDRGRSWKLRSMIANDTDRADYGYSGEEHALARMPNGDLLCVMRTVLGDHPGTTMYLAASRSRDNGYTWSQPESIAPFSVTPLLMALENGMTAVAYGRPGVYVRASSDSGRTWTDALNVVGPSESQLLQDRWWDVRYDDHSDNKISCGNLGAVVSGPDRLLLAYSDFRDRNPGGETVKSVRVQEFIIAP